MKNCRELGKNISTLLIMNISPLDCILVYLIKNTDSENSQSKLT